MDFYYFNLNKDKHGRHEVHKESCDRTPKPGNRELIGLANDCKHAIQQAEKEHFGKKFDGCYYGAYACHVG